MFPTAAQERDGDQEIPLNVSHEPFIPNVPSKREPEAQNQREDYQQEAGVERPTGMPSERASGDAPDPIQPDGPERERQQPRDVLSNVKILQLRTESRGMGLLGRLSSQWMRNQKDSLLSRPFCPSFMFITRCVLDLLLKVPV